MCALGLLTLAAALLGAACLSARAVEHRAQRARASLIAGALAQRALAQVFAPWDARADVLPFGASLDRDLSTNVANAAVRARITRVGARLHLVIVEARLGADAGAPRRRMQLIVESGHGFDGARVDSSPHLIARWSVSELY